MLDRVYKSAVLLICVLISNGFAVEKPTSLQKTCVTEECHAEYGKKAHVHGPVSLGDCTACHKPLIPEEHTWQFERKGRDLCEYCHLEQAAKKIVHEPLKTAIRLPKDFRFCMGLQPSANVQSVTSRTAPTMQAC